MTTPRSARINLRLTPEEHALIEKWAQRYMKSPAAFVPYAVALVCKKKEGR